MKQRLLAFLILALTLLNCYAQENNRWDKVNWLTGEWKGEGSGQPGKGGGSFSFSYDLEKNILVRKSHSEYASNDGKSPIVHEDLMIVYSIQGGRQLMADYFDNEGHIIKYLVSVSENSVIFLSEKQDNAPVFRLSYTLLDEATANVRFEMSSDGVNFKTYVEGKSKRVLQH
jgi:hypothetical protein